MRRTATIHSDGLDLRCTDGYCTGDEALCSGWNFRLCVRRAVVTKLAQRPGEDGASVTGSWQLDENRTVTGDDRQSSCGAQSMCDHVRGTR